MKARRTIPVRLKPTEEQAEKIDKLFSEYRRLVSLLVECCKRAGIADQRRLQELMYGFCRENYQLPSEVIIQGMKLVAQTFRGSYKARHVPKIDADDFPIRLTYGKKHLFYLVFDGGLKVRITLPDGDGFRREEILIHGNEVKGKLSELTRYKISDSLLFPDHRLLITLTKDVEIRYEPENAVGVDIGVVNLVTAYCGGEVLQVSGKPILEAHRKGVEHRRLKQKLGSKKFTYNESKFVGDYVRHAANQVIKFARRFEKPVIVLEDLRRLRKKLRRLPHIYAIAPYELIHSAVTEKALWEGIAVRTRKAYHSSQECPECHHISPKNRKGRRFRCVKCGFEEDADVVAAMNLCLRNSSQAEACGTLAERLCGWENA